MPDTEPTSDIAALTVQLLSAYLANNTVSADDLPGLIRSTRAALVEDSAPAQAEPEAPTYTPAVSVRKSLASADHILSLIDGKPYKTLKRHLASNGLTPEQYRERYNLPASYPMIAPSFAARRREIAEKIGLGNRKAAAGSSATSSPASADVSAELSPSSKPASGTVKPKPAAKTASAATPKPKQRKAASRTDAPQAPASAVAAPSAKPVKKPAKAAAEPDPVAPEGPKAPKARKALAKSPSAGAETGTIPAVEVAPDTAEPETAAAKVETAAAASAETRTPEEAATSPGTTRKQPVKRMARTPKPSITSAGSVPVAQETPAVAEKPKRRRKLGLFGNEAAEATTAVETTAPAIAEAKPRRKRQVVKAR
ncbi:MucR family transcriptional regulator [Sphingobium sp.]|uniref:MucR family transcriptional regulator n=1 Tax=Sphingobium sp. TaxID=1912891 RepID=UPI002D03F18A|nr:MucR family transcriptional regulator [Sphingobium sp.]HUD91421.1 MucR family transcriptional regulator [Sphingobium sp.]